MPGHADRVIKDELDLIAQERIGDKLGNTGIHATRGLKFIAME